jgi:transcriptional regulator with XRE-family HTH domain
MLGFADVPARPIVYKKFGRHLANLRVARGWNQSDAARFAAQKHISDVLTRQVLLHLEAGKTKNPDPAVLRAVAQLYEASYVDVVRHYLIEHIEVQADRYGVSVRVPDEIDEMDARRFEIGHAQAASGENVQRPPSDQNLPAVDAGGDLHHAPNLATTRAAIERVAGELTALSRIAGELTAVARELARGQAAMARPPRSGTAPRHRPRGKERDRRSRAETPPK